MEKKEQQGSILVFICGVLFLGAIYCHAEENSGLRKDDTLSESVSVSPKETVQGMPLEDTGEEDGLRESQTPQQPEEPNQSTKEDEFGSSQEDSDATGDQASDTRNEEEEDLEDFQFPMDGQDGMDMESFFGSEEAPVDENEVKEFMLSADLDENGVLSQVEVLEWVKRSKEKALVNDLQAKWISYDANKDGKISWGEFKKTTFAMANIGGDSEININMQNQFLAQESRRFETADADHNETLDLEEFRAAMFPHLYDHMIDYMVQEMLIDFDKNSDDMVSLEEYVAIIGEYLGSQEPAVMEEMTNQLKAVFKDQDSDGDGYLTREELRAVAVSTDELVPEKETEHLMTDSDVDQNGELDHEEMMKKFNLFKTTLDKMRSALSEDNGADQYEKEEEEETDKEPSGEDDLHDEL